MLAFWRRWLTTKSAAYHLSRMSWHNLKQKWAWPASANFTCMHMTTTNNKANTFSIWPLKKDSQAFCRRYKNASPLQHWISSRWWSWLTRKAPTTQIIERSLRRLSALLSRWRRRSHRTQWSMTFRSSIWPSIRRTNSRLSIRRLFVATSTTICGHRLRASPIFGTVSSTWTLTECCH